MQTFIRYTITGIVYLFVVMVMFLAMQILWDTPPVGEEGLQPIHYAILAGALAMSGIGLLSEKR